MYQAACVVTLPPCITIPQSRNRDTTNISIIQGSIQPLQQVIRFVSDVSS